MRELELESKYGKMVQDTLAIGKIIWLMVKGNFTTLMVICSKAIGVKIKQMALAFIFTLKGVDTKGFGKMTFSMGWAKRSGQINRITQAVSNRA
jgi:hypothetical protein